MALSPQFAERVLLHDVDTDFDVERLALVHKAIGHHRCFRQLFGTSYELLARHFGEPAVHLPVMLPVSALTPVADCAYARQTASTSQAPHQAGSVPSAPSFDPSGKPAW